MSEPRCTACNGTQRIRIRDREVPCIRCTGVVEFRMPGVRPAGPCEDCGTVAALTHHECAQFGSSVEGSRNLCWPCHCECADDDDDGEE
jgi:hypothetical protein